MVNNNRGFSLVELMVVMLISAGVVAAIITTYNSQQKTYESQEVVVEAQQNLRIAMDWLEREIRMAGYNPTGGAAVGIETAGGATIQFTWDMHDGVDNDGDTSVDEYDEAGNSDGVIENADRITFGFDPLNDADIDGIAGNGATSVTAPLGRREGPVGGTFINLANNIEAIGFAYAFDSDGDHKLDTIGGQTAWAYDSDGDGLLDMNLDNNGDGQIDTFDNPGGAPMTVVPIDRIRAVKIWLLARSSQPTEKYADIKTYVVGYNRIKRDDNFQRRLLTRTVECRNLGLDD